MGHNRAGDRRKKRIKRAQKNKISKLKQVAGCGEDQWTEGDMRMAMLKNIEAERRRLVTMYCQ